MLLVSHQTQPVTYFSCCSAVLSRSASAICSAPAAPSSLPSRLEHTQTPERQHGCQGSALQYHNNCCLSVTGLSLPRTAAAAASCCGEVQPRSACRQLESCCTEGYTTQTHQRPGNTAVRRWHRNAIIVAVCQSPVSACHVLQLQQCRVVAQCLRDPHRALIANVVGPKAARTQTPQRRDNTAVRGPHYNTTIRFTCQSSVSAGHHDVLQMLQRRVFAQCHSDLSRASRTDLVPSKAAP